MRRTSEASDDLYVRQWTLAVSNCLESLERDDHRQVKNATSPEAVYSEIHSLQSTALNKMILQELAMLPLSIGHLEDLATVFVANLAGQVTASVCWGMLRLIILLASNSENSLHRLSRMLKVIGRKAELFNGFVQSTPDSAQIKEGALETQLEVLEFLKGVLDHFRHAGAHLGMSTPACCLPCLTNMVNAEDDESAWRPATQLFRECIRRIDESFDRIERLSQVVKSESRLDEVTRLQKLLSLTPEAFDEKANLPCIVLPTMRNTNVYDREDILVKIDDLFQMPDMNERKPRAIALYGLGGVGKSQIALKYAQRRVQDRKLDAVLWAYSETPTALAQSFTNIALRLELPTANPQHHEKNKVLVLDWLQRTRAKWLLIFDNAETSEQLLQYWPLASEGSILLTTRNHGLAFEPAGAGIEITPFESARGSQFLLHLLQMDIVSNLSSQEAKSATELADRLSGHALAISQMAGLIHKRGWGIEEFLTMYSKNAQKLEHKTTLDTIWRLSFDSLDPNAFALLGVLSFLMPDSIPQELFRPENSEAIPESLEFCEDDVDFSDVTETLYTLALVKRDRVSKAFSLHRLVQSQFRYNLSASQFQAAFDETSQLLNVAFPTRPKQSHQMHLVWHKCALYLQHVLSLMDHFNQSQVLRPSQDFCKLLIKCARYLCENGTYKELEDMLKIAQRAVSMLGEADKNPAMLAELAFHNSVQWQQRGDFPLSDKYITDAIALHHGNPDADPYEALKLYNHKSNVQACLKRNDEAYEWQLRIERLHRAPGSEMVKPTTLTMRNMARCLWKVGLTDEALEKYAQVMKLSEHGTANWANLAHSFYGTANIFRSQSLFDEASTNYWKARNTWAENGIPTHEFVGVCYYKLGCVALDRQRVEEAVDHLRAALTIAELQAKYSPGHVARVQFKLAQTLRRIPEFRFEADGMSIQAENTFVTLMKNSPVNLPPVNEEAYDYLVANFWR